MKIEGNNVYYYHNDHLGTPMLMTDSSSTTVWEGEYLPFGEEMSVTGSVTNNLRFPGQYYDEETGLHYNYFRDYNPMIGRYVQADPIGIEQGENHLYGYVGNNPVNFVDPYGNAAISTTILALLRQLAKHLILPSKTCLDDGECILKSVTDELEGYKKCVYECWDRERRVVFMPIILNKECLVSWNIYLKPSPY